MYGNSDGKRVHPAIVCPIFEHCPTVDVNPGKTKFCPCILKRFGRLTTVVRTQNNAVFTVNLEPSQRLLWSCWGAPDCVMGWVLEVWLELAYSEITSRGTPGVGNSLQELRGRSGTAHGVVVECSRGGHEVATEWS